jgi:hypothetical protein
MTYVVVQPAGEDLALDLLSPNGPAGQADIEQFTWYTAVLNAAAVKSDTVIAPDENMSLVRQIAGGVVTNELADDLLFLYRHRRLFGGIGRSMLAARKETGYRESELREVDDALALFDQCALPVFWNEQGLRGIAGYNNVERQGDLNLRTLAIDLLPEIVREHAESVGATAASHLLDIHFDARDIPSVGHLPTRYAFLGRETGRLEAEVLGSVPILPVQIQLYPGDFGPRTFDSPPDIDWAHIGDLTLAAQAISRLPPIARRVPPVQPAP